MSKKVSTVFNPYSKQKNESTKSTTSNRTNANATAQQGQGQGQPQRQGQSQRQGSPNIAPYQPAQVDTRSTFSQTFGDVNANFAKSQAEAKSKKRSADQMISSRRTSTGNVATNAMVSNNSGQSARTTTTTTASTTATTSAASTQQQQTMAVDPSMIQPHVLLVSTKQRGNGLLRSIRNVPYSYSKITPDYIMGPNRCALYLSFKYHNLHPHYIKRRIAELKNDFDLRILLCLVDIEDNATILLKLNQLCVVNNLSLTLAWSEEEAARYLETFKAFEGKDATTIQKKKEVTYLEQATDALGSIRSVNKTDTAQLLSQFGTLKNLVSASMDELRVCPGIGEKKVLRLYDAFTKPFSSSMAKRRKEEKERLVNVANIERDIATVEEGGGTQVTQGTQEAVIEVDLNDDDNNSNNNNNDGELKISSEK